MIVGLEYMSAGNRGADPDAQLDADFAFFKQHKIEYVQLRLVMSGFFPGNSATTDPATKANYLRAVRAAERAGISLGITFWTQPPHDTGSGNNFYPAWVGSFGNLCKNQSIQDRWLAWVAEMVQYLDSPAVAFWQTCNEPYGTGYQAQMEQFIRNTADAIRAHSSKPVSCRFILGWSPLTSRWSNDGSAWHEGSVFDPSLMNSLDFFSCTIYLSPTSEGYNTSSRATWQTLEDSIANARAQGYPSYVVEFGNNSSNDETQRLHYENCIKNRFELYGLTSCAAWAWQTRSPSNESYNICRGTAYARPAFYELEKAVSPPECVSDNDCPPGFICNAGVCVEQQLPYCCTCDTECFATQQELDNHKDAHEAACPSDFQFNWQTCQCEQIVHVCPTGYHWDGSTCVPNLQECPVGYHWDSTQNICVPDVQPCPTGYHWDSTQNICVPDVQPCPDGQHWDGTQCVDDVHVCPQGQHWNGTECVDNGFCFIATACGTNNLSLNVLRDFRDERLPTPLTLAYYRLSPRFAALISTHNHVKQIGRIFWEWIARCL